MKISIVIPAFNEERLLAETLRHIKSAAQVFARRRWETELIVCDNNSTDRTAEIARAEGVTVVFEPINQIGRARNRGAEAASGDWLIFVDADSKPDAVLLEDVAKQIQSGRCMAGGVTVRLEGNHFFANAVVQLWNLVSRIWRWPAGSFVFCDATVFRQIGGFSLELFATEEIDLGQRLKVVARDSGKKIVILHRHPLVTSARKIHLYTPREHIRFLLKTIFTTRKTLANREACHTWYDGRR